MSVTKSPFKDKSVAQVPGIRMSIVNQFVPCDCRLRAPVTLSFGALYRPHKYQSSENPQVIARYGVWPHTIFNGLFYRYRRRIARGWSWTCTTFTHALPTILKSRRPVDNHRGHKRTWKYMVPVWSFKIILQTSFANGFLTVLRNHWVPHECVVLTHCSDVPMIDYNRKSFIYKLPIDDRMGILRIDYNRKKS